MRESSIYIHVPYCRRKCIYCDFYSVGERLADWQAFTDAVAREYAARRSELADSETMTLYIGGGTPSLMPPEAIARLRDMIKIPVTEFTIEVNPDDVTAEKASAWLNAGVNRVSMGVQSLDDGELSRLGRRHDAACARRAYDILNRKFDNISLDLMFGLPGQTLESLSRTIEGFVEMSPQHISAYSLMYEERTALTRMRDAGTIEEQSEDMSIEMFRMVSAGLARAGYERYELSNYARSGYRSRHNSSYWQGIPYIGLGPAAHSYDGNRRRSSNVADVRQYVAFWQNDSVDPENAPADYEILTDEELREEMVLTRLRTVEGLDVNDFRRRFGELETLSLLSRAKKIGHGLLTTADRICLTDDGVMIADDIISSLI